MNYRNAIKLRDISSVKIDKNIKNKELERAARWMTIRSVILYEIGGTFYDDIIEQSFSSIASQLLLSSESGENRKKTDSIVFYDCTSWDLRGLSSQYVDALIRNNERFVYLTENQSFERTNICSKIRNYKNADFIIIPTFQSILKKADYISKIITSINPHFLLLHILPWSTAALISLSLLPLDIIRININITDHAYWSGASLMHYNIEFREYGKLVSINNRKMDNEQEFILPYYPVVEDVSFKGFNYIKTEGRVVLFFGGALYKIYDKEYIFLNLIAKLLKENPNAICICAGGGDTSILLSYIRNNNLSDSWFYIGYRKDIVQVINHCDIIINTYPIGGGLICQYAAMCGKPVISFGNELQKVKSIEGVLSTKEQITYYDENLFIEQANNLISNKEKRDKLGLSLKKSQSNEIIFSRQLKDFLANLSNNRELDISKMSPDGELNEFVQNTRKIDYDIESTLLKNLNIRAFRYYPKLLLWVLKQGISKERVMKLFFR